MKREVSYHEVTVKFIVTEREAARVAGGGKKSDIRSELASLLVGAIGGNGTNSLDAEEIAVIIDGKAVIGHE